MKRWPMLSLMFVFSVVAAAPIQWRGSKEDEGRKTAICQLPHASGQPYQISGKVLRVDPIESLRRDDTCIHFLMQTQEDVVEVHIGTVAQLRKKEMVLSPGDIVDVKGFRLGFRAGNRVIVLAKTIARGREVFVLEGR